MLKKVAIFISILVVLPLVTAFFIKQDYSVDRQVTIERPKTEVFDYIKLLKNQVNYSKWASMDRNMKRTFHGTDGTPGFIMTWSSEDPNVGKGEQEILSIKPGESIDYELRFKEPFESTEKAYMSTATDDKNKTVVTWGFQGSMQYPFNFMALFMDLEQMIGDDLQTGLANLKSILEKNS